MLLTLLRPSLQTSEVSHPGMSPKRSSEGDEIIPSGNDKLFLCTSRC